MRSSHRWRWLRLIVTNHRWQAALGIVLVLAATLGVGSVLIRRAHAATITVCYAPLTGCTYTDIATAVAAATNGDTITVSAQTYAITAPIVITKSITLDGAQAGVDARTRTGAETIIDATGVTTGQRAAIMSEATSVTIDGFTIENAKDECIKGDVASELTIQNNIITSCNTGISEMAGNTILIQQNVIKNMEDLGGATADTAIYNDFTFSDMSIVNNDIVGSDSSLTIVGAPANNPESVTITGNTIENGSTLANLTGTFDHNTVSGNVSVPDPSTTYGIDLAGENSDFTVSNNTFTNFQAYAVAVKTRNDFGYTVDNSNIAIVNNFFNEAVDTENNNSYSYLVDVRDVKGTSNSIVGNNIVLSGQYIGGATSTNAIQVRGSISSLDIAQNTLVGNGGVTSTGIAFVDGLAATSNIMIATNLIFKWVDGLNAPNLTTGATVTGGQNCIYSNSAYGAVNGSTGATISATNDWWGTTSGPNGPGNASGTGNPVTSNITFKPFLTTAPSICATPTSTLTIGSPNVSGSPVQISSTTPLTINASAGAQPVASIRYRVYAQGNTPPAFTTVSGKTTTFKLPATTGYYVVDWYAVDGTGNQEPAHTQTLQEILFTPGEDVIGGPITVPAVPPGVGAANTGSNAGTSGSATGASGPASGQGASGSGASGSGASGSGASGQSTAQQPHASPKPAQPVPGLPLWELIGIVALVALILLGGSALAFQQVMRKRKV